MIFSSVTRSVFKICSVTVRNQPASERAKRYFILLDVIGQNCECFQAGLRCALEESAELPVD